MAKPAPTHKAPPLQVKVLSPFSILYEGPAVSVSAENEVGPFDVLEDHTNFFSLLKAGEVRINTGTDERHVPAMNGIIHVRANRVTIFVDI